MYLLETKKKLFTVGHGQFNQKNMLNIKKVNQNMFNVNMYFTHVGFPFVVSQGGLVTSIQETGRFTLYQGVSQLIWESWHRCLDLVVV